MSRSEDDDLGDERVVGERFEDDVYDLATLSADFRDSLPLVLTCQQKWVPLRGQT